MIQRQRMNRSYDDIEFSHPYYRSCIRAQVHKLRTTGSVHGREQQQHPTYFDPAPHDKSNCYRGHPCKSRSLYRVIHHVIKHWAAMTLSVPPYGAYINGPGSKAPAFMWVFKTHRPSQGIISAGRLGTVTSWSPGYNCRNTISQGPLGRKPMRIHSDLEDCSPHTWFAWWPCKSSHSVYTEKRTLARPTPNWMAHGVGKRGCLLLFFHLYIMMLPP